MSLPVHAIEASGLTKRFPAPRRWRELLALRPARHVDALRGVSIAVPRGTVHGLLGANGAGKTTLLKILATLVVPTSGSASVAGFDVAAHPDAARARLGLVVAEERSFYWRLSGRDNLLFFAALQDVSARERRARVDEALAITGLEADASRSYREYSSGMRQRLSIARGLLGSPEVMLMDEPTRALDPPSAHAIRTFVRDRLVKERGTTVLLATHDLLEAETTCDALSLVEGGLIVATGTPHELRRPLGGAARTAITLLPPLASGVRPADGEAVEDLPAGARRLIVPGTPDDVARRVAELVGAGARIAAVEPRDADLSSLFQRLAAAGGPDARSGSEARDTPAAATGAARS